MLVCMKRTTLVLEDGLVKAVRDMAHQTGRDMSSVVNEFIREGLSIRKRPSKEQWSLPKFSMGRPRADLADRDDLERVMENP